MNTPFILSRTDNSFGALLNRAVIGAFTLAVIGAVGMMTFAQFLTIA